MIGIEFLSDRLFGRKIRLPLAVWIHDLPDGTFYQQQAASETGIPQSNVRDELNTRLVPLGMLQEVPKTAGDRRQYYARTKSPLWQIVDAAIRATQSAASTTTDRTATGAPERARA